MRWKKKGKPLDPERTSAQKFHAEPFADVRQSPLGLEHCPIYRPTEEEFRDSLSYISSIRKEAEKYGICKIIPPNNWKPPFSVDTEVKHRVFYPQNFSFEPRLQKINEMNGTTRNSLTYTENLFQYHQQQNNPLSDVPTVGGKMIDLLGLKRIVESFGGFENPDRIDWESIAVEMNLLHSNDGEHREQSVAEELERLVVHVIAPYEEYIKRNSKHRKHQKSHELHPKRSQSTEDAPGPPRPGEEMCEICGKGEDPESMLLCDDCDRGHHIYCLDPPLEQIPKEEWYCASCLATTGHDFGFEYGKKKFLSDFLESADDFKRKHFQKDPNTPVSVSESQVEEEYWKLAQTPFEEVQVGYGADLHSTEFGSGFPVFEKNPLNPYSQCSWNLNNISILPKSLLRNIPSSVSGMTNPWLYVGMVFSTFCWHVEDHNLYSINYLHLGETKTWYGVPSSEADKFEDAMRAIVPELFENIPDLLFHIITIVSPLELAKHGVKSYFCDQRQGEFVVTFPRAYHGGFNQGFNFAEAVNFALPYWLALGRECIENYSLYGKLPVFSHNELLYLTLKKSDAWTCIEWLLPEVEEMVRSELEARKRIAAKASELKRGSVVIENPKRLRGDLSEDTERKEVPNCRICKRFTYLTCVKCVCGKDSALCLTHAFDDPCKCSSGSIVVQKRFSDEELVSILEAALSIVERPRRWANKYRELVVSPDRPDLKELADLYNKGTLIDLLSDEYKGDMFKAERRLLRELGIFIEAAREVQEQIDEVLEAVHQGPPPETTPQAGKRGRKRESSEHRTLIPFDTIESLNEKISAWNIKLSENSNEFYALYRELKECKRDIQALLSRTDGMATANEVSSLVSRVKNLNVTMPEVVELESHLGNRRFDSMVSQFLDERGIPSLDFIAEMLAKSRIPVPEPLNLFEYRVKPPEDLFIHEDVTRLLAEGRKTGVKPSHKGYNLLKKWREAGDNWRLRVVQCLKQRNLPIDEISYIFVQSELVPIEPLTYLDFVSLADSVVFWIKSVRTAYGESTHSVSNDEPVNVKTLLKLAKEAEDLPVAKYHDYSRIRDDIATINTWQAQVKKALFKSTPPSAVLRDLLADMARNVVRATDMKEPIDFLCYCGDPKKGRTFHCSKCKIPFHKNCAKDCISSPEFEFLCSVCLNVREPEGSKADIGVIRELIYSCQHLRLISDELEYLQLIEKHVDAFDKEVNEFVVNFSSNPSGLNAQDYLRRIKMLSFEITATSSLQLLIDDAGLKMNLVERPQEELIGPRKSQNLHCLCRKPDVDGLKMVACDACSVWYHLGCVNLNPKDLYDRKPWFCPICRNDIPQPEWHMLKMQVKKRKSMESSLVDGTEKRKRQAKRFPDYVYDSAVIAAAASGNGYDSRSRAPSHASAADNNSTLYSGRSRMPSQAVTDTGKEGTQSPYDRYATNPSTPKYPYQPMYYGHYYPPPPPPPHPSHYESHSSQPPGYPLQPAYYHPMYYTPSLPPIGQPATDQSNHSPYFQPWSQPGDGQEQLPPPMFSNYSSNWHRQ